MTDKRNNAEGGTNATGVTTGNSGGASGDAFSAVNPGTGGTIVFSTGQAAHGTLSYLYTPATSFACSVILTDGSTSTTFTARYYIRITGYPAAETIFGDIQTTGGTTVARMHMTATGAYKLVNAAGTAIATFTNVLSLNTWYRVTLWGTVHATTGTFNASLYLGDSVTAIETKNQTNVNTGSTAAGRFVLGRNGTPAMAAFNIDDIAANMQSSTEYAAAASSASLPSTSTTESAGTLTGALTGTFPRASDTETAPTLAAAKVASLPTVTSTDTAQTVVGALSGSTPQTSSSESAGTLAGAKTAALPTTGDTGATGGAGAKAAALPQVSTTEVARTLTFSVSSSLPLVTTLETAQALTGAKTWQIIGPSTIETARTVTGAKTGTFPTATTTETPRNFTTGATGSLPKVTEVGSAGTLTGSKSAPVASVATSEAARSITGAKTGSAGQISTTETARPWSGALDQTGALPKPLSVDVARPLTGSKTAPAPAASTTEGAGSVSGAAVLPLLVSLDTARALTALKSASLPRVLEVDDAFDLTGASSQPVPLPKTRSLARVTVPNVAVSLGVTSRNTLTPLP